MAASVQLTTLADCKRYLQVDDNTHDAFLNTLIAAAGEAVEQYCGREFGRRVRTEYYDGKGMETLLLKVRPVVRVIELCDDMNRLYAPSSRIQSDRFVVYPDDGLLRLASGVFAPGLRNVRVSYEAGYQTVPASLAQAVQLIVASVWTRARQGADALQSESIGAYTVSYDTADWPSQARTLLSRFREIPL